MLIIVAALALNLNLGSVANQKPVAPTVTCGIKTVSYRFTGTPGTEFKYSGKTYRVPTKGSIELLADQNKTTYEVAGTTLPLNVWAADDFGTRSVPLPVQQ